MRAEYAISLRKQEQTVEILKARAQKQLIEIAERNAEIRDMKREMSEVTALADRRYQEKEQLRSRLSVANRSGKPDRPPQINNTQSANSGTETSKVPTTKQTPEPQTSKTAPPGEPRLPGVPGPEKKSTDSGTQAEKGLAGRIYKLKNKT